MSNAYDTADRGVSVRELTWHCAVSYSCHYGGDGGVQTGTEENLAHAQVHHYSLHVQPDACCLQWQWQWPGSVPPCHVPRKGNRVPVTLGKDFTTS